MLFARRFSRMVYYSRPYGTDRIPLPENIDVTTTKEFDESWPMLKRELIADVV